jgi:hypothetical protein
MSLRKRFLFIILFTIDALAVGRVNVYKAEFDVQRRIVVARSDACRCCIVLLRKEAGKQVKSMV